MSCIITDKTIQEPKYNIPPLYIQVQKIVKNYVQLHQASNSLHQSVGILDRVTNIYIVNNHYCIQMLQVYLCINTHLPGGRSMDHTGPYVHTRVRHLGTHAVCSILLYGLFAVTIDELCRLDPGEKLNDKLVILIHFV